MRGFHAIAVGVSCAVSLVGCFLDHGAPPVEDAGFDVPDAGPCAPGAPCDCRAAELVPSGTHIVGANIEDACDFRDDFRCTFFGGPAHLAVLTRAVFVARYEASSGCWARCVREGACRAEAAAGCADGECGPLMAGYWRDPDRALLPAINLTYRGATEYCSFLGGRLPTNAEWEKAARGEEGRRWPWAGVPDDPLNIDRTELAEMHALWVEGPIPAHRDQTAVGTDFIIPIDSFPEGRGIYGHYGLMGNAWEWVFDWMEFYDTETVIDPMGPTVPDMPDGRVLRPGEEYIWGRVIEYTDVGVTPGVHFYPHGARCAFDAEPEPLPMWETMAVGE